jgi:dTDP-4-amino-4,6-dideoxygalactose transaminase
MCAHREEAYPSSTWTCGAANCGCVAGSCARLFESESAQDRCIMLPLYAQMTHADQERVVVALRDALRSTVHSG